MFTGAIFLFISQCTRISGIKKIPVQHEVHVCVCVRVFHVRYKSQITKSGHQMSNDRNFNCGLCRPEKWIRSRSTNAGILIAKLKFLLFCWLSPKLSCGENGDQFRYETRGWNLKRRHFGHKIHFVFCGNRALIFRSVFAPVINSARVTYSPNRSDDAACMISLLSITAEDG